MNKFLLCTTFGLCLLQLCLAETQFNISCRYAGVFHVERNRRYSLTRSEAVELCRALNSTLPTMEQMKKAHSLGFETCRYGYIEDKIVVPRINPYHLCAANSTGIYILASNITDRYDTYCYNTSETREKACEPIIKLDASWPDDESQIVIDNADGSRYTGGVRNTDPTPVTDDDNVDSGSTHDRGATNPTIIRTHMPDAPYDKKTTPDALSTDYSGFGRKEYHPTSTNDIAIHLDDKQNEASTVISLLTDGVPGKGRDVNKGQHPTSTTIIRADEDSQHGSHHENSTQGQDIFGFIPLQRHSTHHKEEFPTTVIKDEDSHHGANHENSTRDHLTPGFIPVTWHSTDHKKEHLTSASKDVDSQANTTDDEDFRRSLLNHGFLLEGDNNETREEHPTSIYVNSHDDGADDEDSTEEPLKPTVLPGWGINDVKKEYPPSTTVETIHGAREETSTQLQWNQFADSWWWSQPDHKEQQSTQATGDMTSHGDRTDDEDSTQDPLIPVISLGGEHSSDKEQHPPSTNEDSQDYGVDDEDSTEDPLHSGILPGWDKNDDKEQHPPLTNVDSYGVPKHIETTQDPLLHNVYLGGDKDENKYPTNTSVDSMKPPLFPAMERDRSSSSVTVNNEIGRNVYTPTAVVVSKEAAKNDDTTQDPLLNGAYPRWSNKVEYSTNATRDDMLPGVIPSHENEHSTTDNHPGWDSEDKYHTNTSRDYGLHGLIPPNENEYESYTAVVSSNGATLEDSTQDPLLHSVHPRWGNEDKYLKNTSGDDDLPGSIPPSETEHKNESSHTVVISNDGAKHEDSTKDPLATGIQPGRDNEDKYPTNNTRDNMIPGVFSDIESRHGREPASTATSFTFNNHGDRRGQSGWITTPKILSQPRSAQIPEWLIIVASLLALTLILAVCIAVNSRRRCGQKRKLVINNGKGSVSDTKMGGLNGEASKSQEMVHLVHKEQPVNQKGSCDEFLTTDETQNQKEADMKTGM